MKIALFTMAVGEDPIYFDSVARYFPYNKKYFGQDNEVDYYLFIDREEEIEGIINIPCKTTVWPYTTMLKNNFISDYLDSSHKWDHYDYIFFIDADFAIGDRHDFFSHNFVLVKNYWNDKYSGRFYGGKSAYFKILCNSFYNEIKFVFENKLFVPVDLDEFYLSIFQDKYKEIVCSLEMMEDQNVLTITDNENPEEEIREKGNFLFLLSSKPEKEANTILLRDPECKEKEYVIDLENLFIYARETSELGHLVPIDENNYQILWSKRPEVREVLNTKINRITRRVYKQEENKYIPLLSIVMPVYNESVENLKDSIQSILNQTFVDFELIIVNDGSTELDGIDYINSCNDPRIRLINNDHDFISTLNRGVKESRGKYLVRMDADDIMLPHRLEYQYYYMEDHPEVDVCGSWVELCGNRDGILKCVEEYEDIMTSLIMYNSMSHPTIIMRENVFRKEEPLYEYEYPCAEDYRLWTVLLMQGYRIVNIPEVLLYYRSSEKQTTYVKWREMTASAREIQREYVEEVTNLLVQEKPQLLPLLEMIFKLYNEDALNFDTVKNLISPLFSSYLKEKKVH